MFRYLKLVGFLVLAGCAPRHYTENSGDLVTLYLENPGAAEVLFVSSAEDFRPRPAEKDLFGRWVVTTPSHFEFRYFYKINGRTELADCRYREFDDFGSSNCVYRP